MNPESIYEFEMMTEPEINSEFSHPLPDTNDWDSLKDVPFAGDLLDDPVTGTELPETDVSGFLDSNES